MAKVVIYLREHEHLALKTLAQHECRKSNAQAVLILRQELTRLGLIEIERLSPLASAQPSLTGTVEIGG